MNEYGTFTVTLVIFTLNRMDTVVPKRVTVFRRNVTLEDAKKLKNLQYSQVGDMNYEFEWQADPIRM